MKKWKKAVTISVACLTGIGVLAGGLYESSLSVQAVDTFMAVRNMKSQYSVSDDTTVIASTFRVLEIADNGTGISPEIKEKIFEPFFSTKDVEEGMGLGLALVQTILTSYDGKIDAFTNDSGGATFKVELPVM